MARPSYGYATVVGDGPGAGEWDTITCAHCNSVFVLNHDTSPDQAGGFCLRCMKSICTKAKCHEGCVPFERKLDRYEKIANRRAALLRAVTGGD